MDQSKFSIVIPSKVIDNNLINCESSIRSFYKEIKIFLLVDFNNTNTNFSSNTFIIETGLVNVSEKRNIGIRLTKSEYIVFIDSDAYPKHPWLNNIEKIFKSDSKVGACGGANISPYSDLEERKFISAIKKSFVVSQNVNSLKYKRSKSRPINFLPTCNLVVRSAAISKSEPMDSRLFAHEDISLNQNIKDKGFSIFFEPSAYIYHKDRSIKSFLKQRFTYGTEALNVFIRYPCKASLNLFLSTLPFVSFLIFSFLCLLKSFEVNNFTPILYLLFKLSLVILISSSILIIFESFKVFYDYKKNFLKIIYVIFLSVFLPGRGQVARPFLNWKLRRKIWVH